MLIRYKDVVRIISIWVLVTTSRHWKKLVFSTVPCLYLLKCYNNNGGGRFSAFGLTEDDNKKTCWKKMHIDNVLVLVLP